MSKRKTAVLVVLLVLLVLALEDLHVAGHVHLHLLLDVVDSTYQLRPYVGITPYADDFNVDVARDVWQVATSKVL